MKEIFLGLGGNIGDVFTTLESVKKAICSLPDVYDVVFSRFYVTTPVSSIPQNNFINAVAKLKSSLDPITLLNELEKIETAHGKVKKEKDQPRPVDIDILLYGDDIVKSSRLTIPHPCFLKRLFVMIPLLDLTETVYVPGVGTINIRKQMEDLKIQSKELVILLNDKRG